MFKDYCYNNFQIDFFEYICRNPYHYKFDSINVCEAICVDVSELIGLHVSSLNDQTFNVNPLSKEFKVHNL